MNVVPQPFLYPLQFLQVTFYQTTVFKIDWKIAPSSKHTHSQNITFHL